MQLKMILSVTIVAFSLFSGCKSSVQMPIAAEDIAICKNPDALISIVRKISSDQKLDFKYSMHEIDYGTQTTFRLKGDGYEILLFNAFEQNNYVIRIYQIRSGDEHKEKGIIAYNKFKEALSTQAKCPDIQTP
ncbi:MAG: hypothetical protein AAGC58_02740 [Asticcacaulis sp.]